MKKKLKNLITGISMAMSSVEKNALKQTDDFMSSDITKNQRLNQGTLLDSLINGEVTQEVENLRWRTAKVFAESAKIRSVITGYDDNGYPIVEYIRLNKTLIPPEVLTGSTDSLNIEMVVNNREIAKSVTDTLYEFESSDLKNVIEEFTDKDGHTVRKYKTVSATKGKLMTKAEKKIYVVRSEIPMFEFEQHIIKVMVKEKNEVEKQLDCYISKCPNTNVPTSTQFLNELSKIKDGKRTHIFNVDKLGFITESDIGVEDEFIYEYGKIRLDTIIDHKGYYIVKLICEPLIDGEYVNEKYRVEEIDKKYDERNK